jgi:exopolysaccharide biosynthesis polyprenyl glycosylphosphotransferase
MRVALGYAVATTAAAVVAVITVKESGPVVWWAAWFVALGLLVEFVTLESYERIRSLRPAGHLITFAGAGLLLATVFTWLTPGEVRGAFFVVAAGTTVIVGAVIGRKLTRAPHSTLLVGDRAGVGHFVAQWGSRADIEMRGICLAETAEDLADTPQEIMGIPVFGALADVAEVALDLAVDKVVVAPGPVLTAYDVRRMSWALEGTLIELTVAAEVHGAVPHRIQPRILGRRLLLSVRPGKRPRAVLWAKGAIDRIVAAFLLLLFSPVFLVLAIVVRRDSPGPAFFTQTRSGLDGKPFRMYKFRTMVLAAETLLAELMADNEGAGPLFKLTDDPRTTRIGKLLRRTSLDELPQLLNVVKGDMSLIGPRPGLPNETDQYDEWIRRRLRVKPGMTGAWQVSGRSNLSWQDSVRLDIDYVDNWTLRDDFRIVAKTARAVIRRDGAV